MRSLTVEPGFFFSDEFAAADCEYAQSLVSGASITRAQATQEPRLAQQFVAAAELTALTEGQARPGQSL